MQPVLPARFRTQLHALLAAATVLLTRLPLLLLLELARHHEFTFISCSAGPLGFSAKLVTLLASSI